LNSAQGAGFTALVGGEAILKLVNYPSLAQELYSCGFLPPLLEKVKHSDSRVRVNILKILTSIYEHARKRDRRAMVKEFGLKNVVKEMVKDSALLVQELATQLLAKIE